MGAIVVYQSLWGNTAAIARAIAEGLGYGAAAYATKEITPADAAAAPLLVVGAPVHALSLPSKDSVDSVRKRPLGPGELAPEVEQPLLRDWIEHLPISDQLAASFDTRVKGLFGKGGVSTIDKVLKARGRSIATQGKGFIVINQRSVTGAGTMLREGELAAARAWGAQLGELIPRA